MSRLRSFPARTGLATLVRRVTLTPTATPSSAVAGVVTASAPRPLVTRPTISPSSKGPSSPAHDATSFVSVLSMPTLMKELVPRLAAAADGDPGTPTDEAQRSGTARRRFLPARPGGSVRAVH